MGAYVFPVDAVSGAPSYTGTMARQTLGALASKNTTRPLGARSGIHPATPDSVFSVSGTTWTVGAHGGILDTEASGTVGPYLYSFDSNQTGSVNAADATNPRWDLLSVQLSDPASGDGTSTPGVAIVYTAGTAAASPSLPATPARSLALAQITVPHSGGGASSTTVLAPYSAAAGGVIRCRNSTEYPSAPYDGQAVYDSSLSMVLVYEAAVSLWIPASGARLFEQVTQVASWTDFGSGTLTALTTCPGIPVPQWARDGSASAVITMTANALIITNPGAFLVRIVLGATVPSEAPQSIAGNASGTAAESAGLFCAGTFTIPAATTSLTPVFQSQRTGGTGALRSGSTGSNGLVVWSALITR